MAELKESKKIVWEWLAILKGKEPDWEIISNYGEIVLQWYTVKHCVTVTYIAVGVLVTWMTLKWVLGKLGHRFKSSNTQWVRKIGHWLEAKHVSLHEMLPLVAEANRKEILAEAAKARQRIRN